MRKKLAISIFGAIVALLVITSFVLLDNTFPLKSQSNNWKNNLDNFATALAFDDGKVFVTDNPGNVKCLDAPTGNVIWTTNVGDWTSNAHLITVSKGIVYVGAGGGAVDTLSETSGKLLPLSFTAPATTSWGQKQAPQQFFVSEGRIFVSQNGWGVFNVSNGDLFWKSGELGLTVGNTSYSSTDINPVFIQRTIRFNPNNGSIIWQVNGDASDPAVIVQDKVILWNYNANGSAEEGQVMLCVNASNGENIWHFDVQSKMYQPTLYNGLVLFGAYDGNFYALHLSDGSIAWKTHVTDQNGQENLPGQDVHYPLTPSVSLVQIDEQSKSAFWAFTFSQNGWGGTDIYKGIVCSLDLTSGHVLWKTAISQNVSISGSGNVPTTELGLTLLNNKVFLTSGSDLMIINQSSGFVEENQHFDHYVLAPVAGDKQVFVAGDLNVFSYK
ncbi:MAG: PQQ-binding-like beta-propeller repeat protein [Candidatus Bathyarchaeia archaeon]|jgi:outer membrane protein assembly factor BamB